MPVKSKVKILQNVMAFSEYMNFTTITRLTPYLPFMRYEISNCCYLLSILFDLRIYLFNYVLQSDLIRMVLDNKSNYFLSIYFNHLPFSEASETYVYPDLNQDPVPNQVETMSPMIEINSSEPFTQTLENLFYNFQDTKSAKNLLSTLKFLISMGP